MGIWPAILKFWVAFLSKGGLIEPSRWWMSFFSKFEDIFRIIHDSNFEVNQTPGIVKYLASLLTRTYIDVPPKVITFYARVRTMIRIRHLNRKLEDERFMRQERTRNT